MASAPMWPRCYDCGSEGTLLTPAGEQVLELVGRHFKGLLREAME